MGKASTARISLRRPQMIEPTSVARSTKQHPGKSNSSGHSAALWAGRLCDWRRPLLRAGSHAPNLEDEEVNRLPAIDGAVNCDFEVA